MLNNLRRCAESLNLSLKMMGFADVMQGCVKVRHKARTHLVIRVILLTEHFPLRVGNARAAFASQNLSLESMIAYSPSSLPLILSKLMPNECSSTSS